jgi:hypothetical protein
MRGKVNPMNTTTTKALLLGLLALAWLATPMAVADGEPGSDAGTDPGPCEPIELMTFAPYVAFHPECIEKIVPRSSSQP